MNYYRNDVIDVIDMLESNQEGLDDKEVEIRLEKNGKNVLYSTKKHSRLKKFIKQFQDVMIVILILSSIISFFVAYFNSESYIDSIAIIFIVLLNAILGYIQEMKADNALEKLKKMQISNVKVKRNGEVKIVDFSDLVVGDIILLEAGDKVPADARIISCTSLKCEESSLTGESLPVEKTYEKIKNIVPIAERYNMIFAGTSIVFGKCTAIVTAIGMQTEFGLIAKDLEIDEKEKTPLEVKIDNISKFLAFVIIIIISFMFIYGIMNKIKTLELLMLSISLAVAAIPEGLPAIITIILSLSVSNMAKKNAIVRKMSSIETLGCTEVICSDKTGTITQNKMTVKKLYFDSIIYNNEEFVNEDFINMLVLNNDVEKVESNYVGDPSEIAFCNYLDERKIDSYSINKKYPRLGEIPFDSDRKLMSTINDYNGKVRIITKGSFDSIINCSTKFFEDGKINELTIEQKNRLKKIESKLSAAAYRIIAFAYKEIKGDYVISTDLESDLIFMGLVCMIDPPREDVIDSINYCKQAGIRTIMITGDSLQTACAIGKDIGMITENSEAISGEELDKMTKKELTKAVNKYSVYARVSPKNKLDIVNALKANNRIVAMTGDGVNDAPALKAAMIGIGMGITGTEVSKSVSDIVLADDSFSTIVTAIKEGRKIFDNIRNILVFLLAGNICEILIVLIGLFFGFQIFLPIQLLYINLITDSIPAISLAFEEKSDDILKEKNRKGKSFFTPFIISKIMLTAFLKALTILSIYFIGVLLYDQVIANTMAFLSLILLEIVFTYSCRNLKRPVLGKYFLKNKYLNYSILFLIIVQILVFISPIRLVFGIVDLSILQYICCIVVVLLIFISDELCKKIFVKLFRD